ncbi:transglutaminase superfamily protein [Lutibacter sp. Hel_I_33_5]|uniref:transglutaminase domain-containing protein n=1 Tax=Lutibacter sp. Hel_I_33_5 TaxID=1566289 RepID=UPI00119CBC78|nr:transglutaminase domain-containing protein [Lutibacter sp. Hel_I_33_5]TVZ56947.1 transglutaminase superfamily protein [Lutibacter sp. Hel_I_33_5]
MKQLFFFLLLVFSYSSGAQNFAKVENSVNNYPRFSSAKNLANQIQKDFNSDENKAYAAFYWLAKNIRYNLKEFYNPKPRSFNFSYSSEEEKEQKLQNLKDELVSKAFRNKTGVCEEYAQAFKKVGDLLGLETEVITGNVRISGEEIGVIPQNSNHAWNAVKLNNKWIILDATWAAGYENNGKWIRDFNSYFWNIPADNIFKTHLPEDSLWILRFGRISKEEFYNQPIYNQKFLNYDLTLVSPLKGIIDISKNDTIQLKIKNLHNKKVIYLYEGQQYAKKPSITLKGDISILTFKNPQRNSLLYVFIENELALEYKVIIN